MFEFTDRSKDYSERVQTFMDRHVYPAEALHEELENHLLQVSRMQIIAGKEARKPRRAEGQSQGRGPMEHVHRRGTFWPGFVEL